MRGRHQTSRVRKTGTIHLKTEVWKKSTAFLLKTRYFSPSLSIQCWESDETAGKWRARLSAWSSIRMWSVRRNAKSADLSQDFCLWSQIQGPVSLSLWLVPSKSLSASASNEQLFHLVWCSLRALMTLTSPKSKELSLVHKSRVSKSIFHGSRENRKPVSRGRKNIESRITEKINPYSRLTQSKKCPFTRHEKS